MHPTKARILEIIRDRCERGAVTPTYQEISFLAGCSIDSVKHYVPILEAEGEIETKAREGYGRIFGIGPYWTVWQERLEKKDRMGRYGASPEFSNWLMVQALGRYFAERKLTNETT
jgi:hypothetical protein